MLEQLAERGEYLVSRAAGQHQRPPGHSQADAERGFGRASPADVADEGVHPAVAALHHIVEVSAEQHVLAAGQAARGHAEPRVGQQRRRQQATLKPGIFLGVDLRRVEFPLGLLGPSAFHRIPDHPVQHVPGDLALDQVVLRAGPDRPLPQVLIGLTGQHDDGGIRVELEQFPEAVQAARVRQSQIEQDAGRVGDQGLGLGEGPRPLHDHRGSDFKEQFLYQQGIAVIVLDEQDLNLVMTRGRRRGLEPRVTCQWNPTSVAGCERRMLAFVEIPSCTPRR